MLARYVPHPDPLIPVAFLASAGQLAETKSKMLSAVSKIALRVRDFAHPSLLAELPILAPVNELR